MHVRAVLKRPFSVFTYGAAAFAYQVYAQQRNFKMRSFRVLMFLSFSLAAMAADGKDAHWWAPATPPEHYLFSPVNFNLAPTKPVRTSVLADHGIAEVVPKVFQERYKRWKAELLATEFGREQWDLYANRKNFLLKIVVSADRKYGAGTDEWVWDDNGRLIAATITIGAELDEGFPDPVYYPVMNSLARNTSDYQVSGAILASTKLVHEIEHVNFTSQKDGKVYRRQNSLMASYNKILLKNGHDTNDPSLTAIAGELGGTPVEVWEDREYWSEVGAMRFLLERISGESFYCSVLSRMRRNIADHTRNYRDRFQSVADHAQNRACRNQ